MFQEMVRGLSTASDTQLAARLREDCERLLANAPSEAECYDLLVQISGQPCQKVSDKVCVGEISSFVREFCNVAAHYPRPVEEGK